MLDMLVLPSLLVEKHRTELTNEQGKLDISKPYTQLCIRELMKEMFDAAKKNGLTMRMFKEDLKEYEEDFWN